MSDEQVDDVLLAVLRQFANEELDQWESFVFGSEHGPVYVTISRQPDPDGRHYDRWKMVRDELGRDRAFSVGPDAPLLDDTGDDLTRAELIAEFRRRLNVMSGEELADLEGLADDARGGALVDLPDGQQRLGSLVLKALAEIRTLRVEMYAVIDWAVRRGYGDETLDKPNQDPRPAVVAAAMEHLLTAYTTAGALAWWSRPHPQLDGRTPADLLDTPTGHRRLINVAAGSRGNIAT